MKIVFSEHSKSQNKFRKIPITLVKQVINKSDEVIDSYRNRQLRRKSFENKILEVVTVTESSIIMVITFYWLERD